MNTMEDMLLVLLWRLRREISTRHEIVIPPSWIFTDEELKTIAHERPRTMEELSRLSGIDARRAKTSGPEFLEVVAQAPVQVSATPAPPTERSSATSAGNLRAPKPKQRLRRSPPKRTPPDPPRSQPAHRTSATGRGGPNLFNTYGQQDYRPGGGGRYDG